MRATTPNLQTPYFKGSLGGHSVETRENVDSGCNSGVGLDHRRCLRTLPGIPGIDRSTKHARRNGQPARVSESAAPVPLRRARWEDERHSALVRVWDNH